MRGVNFLQIGEQIADRNKWEFCRRGKIYHFSRVAAVTEGMPLKEEDVLDDIMFSFPSSDCYT